MTAALIKNLKLVILLLLAIGWRISAAQAAEITAVDFNGNVIGQVISTGMVINGDGENIGYITADSLIVDNNNEVIGGVVPQGVAIGNDNRPLGKINSDGVVRSMTGKPLGKALPNGLVVDSGYNIIGSVLFPGLVYSAEGNTIGRLTGAGTYTNLDGTEIGFVSANGYAYRQTAGDYALDGRLMSSKMVVSLNGDFIGSIAPSGKVIDFEGKEIGYVHANEYVYSPDKGIIGRVVRTGYAFDLAGRYMGVITYNGIVLAGDTEVGRYRADGNIVNKDNQVIGFSVSLAATANDLRGNYLGRVLPKGLVVKDTSVIGRVGAKGFVYDLQNKKIGQLTQTGPVFNATGQLSGQSMSSGAYISLKGGTQGRMHGSFAFDSNGMLVGGIVKNMIAFNNSDKALGSVEADASVSDGSGRQKASPFGYMFTADNKLSGAGRRLLPVYGLEGQVYSYITPNGSLYRSMTDVKLNMNGILLGKNGYVASMLNPLYALSFKGQNLGSMTATNIILDEKGAVAYKVVPDNYVVESAGGVAQNVMPLRGYAGENRVVIGIGGDLLGYADSDGSVFDLSGNIYGKALYGNYVSDGNNAVTGKVMPFSVVYNDTCSAVGIMNGRGEIVNSRGVAIGKMLPNGQAISDVGSYIGFTVSGSGLVDFDGNYAGAVNAGSGMSYAGKNLGCVSRKGIISNADNQWLYGVIQPNPVIDFENNIIGQVLANGTIADNNSQILGSVQPNGNAVSKSKKSIGNAMRYKVAFKNDNTFLGMVQNSGQIVNAAGTTVGQINFDGSVQHEGEQIGYALYDWYVYNNDFVVYGYIMRDGTVLNTSGSRLGKIDKGFVVDKNGQPVARGNRDYTVRDVSNNAIGELQIDGNVLDYKNQNVGYLSDNGTIRNVSGDEIAKAYPLQYYQVSESKADTDNRRDWADYKKVQIQDEKPQSGNVQEQQNSGGTGSFNRRVIGIALNPDGDILGSIYNDNKVYDDNGTQIGFRTPDGMIVDMKYNPIGVEEVKNASAKNMFVPAGTFGSGNAYGIGSKPSSLGPGGGYGAGERYDPVKANALAQMQNARRSGIHFGKKEGTLSPSTFTGYEEYGWNESKSNISTWRVDMSHMILQDKPIPAVLSRSVYASDGLGTGVPVTAIVERNIYSEEGRNIIIPAGSRVIGSMGSGSSGMSSTGGNSGGAVKIGISWSRLIRPDGSQFEIGSATTADAQGRAGAIGYLDEQLLKKYSAPMLMTAMESATAYMMASGEGSSESSSGSTTTSSKSQAAEDARQNFLNQMQQIFDDIVQAKANIRAVTYIPAGTRIIIFPNQDLWLRTEEDDKWEHGGRNNKGNGGSDLNQGLTTEPDKYIGSDSRGGNSYYTNEYEEDIRPTGGNRNAAAAAAAANRRQQQRTQQNGGVPADIQQSAPISTPEDDDVPSLL